MTHCPVKPHPECMPFVARHDGRVSVCIPVIDAAGNWNVLRRDVPASIALTMASELLAGAAHIQREAERARIATLCPD